MLFRRSPMAYDVFGDSTGSHGFLWSSRIGNVSLCSTIGYCVVRVPSAFGAFLFSCSTIS